MSFRKPYSKQRSVAKIPPIPFKPIFTKIFQRGQNTVNAWNRERGGSKFPEPQALMIMMAVGAEALMARHKGEIDRAEYDKFSEVLLAAYRAEIDDIKINGTGLKGMVDNIKNHGTTEDLKRAFAPLKASGIGYEQFL
jgi:hypothetical protein